MFTGLYLVLWAKRNEGIVDISDVGGVVDDDDDDPLDTAFDVEKPLLS